MDPNTIFKALQDKLAPNLSSTLANSTMGQAMQGKNPLPALKRSGQWYLDHPDNISFAGDMQTVNPGGFAGALNPVYNTGVDSMTAKPMAGPSLARPGIDKMQPMDTSQLTSEQIIEQTGGWQPGVRAKFDTAMLTKDAPTVSALLPQVPEAYRASFAQDISNILKPVSPSSVPGLPATGGQEQQQAGRFNLPAQVNSILGMNGQQAQDYRNKVDQTVPSMSQDTISKMSGNSPIISGGLQMLNSLPGAVEGAASLPAARNVWQGAGDVAKIASGALTGVEGLDMGLQGMSSLMGNPQVNNEIGGATVGKTPGMKANVNAAYNSGNITAQEAKMGYGIRPLAKESVDPLTLHGDYFAGDSLKRGANVINDMKGDSVYKLWKAGKADEIPGVGEGIVRRLDLIFKDGRLNNANVANALKQNIPAESAITPMDMTQAGPYTRWPQLNVPDAERASNMWVNLAAKAKVAGEEIPPQVMQNLPKGWEKMATLLGYSAKLLK